MNAPDSHLILKGSEWTYEDDEQKVYSRAGARELALLYRQKTYTLLGQPRYIIYWQDVTGAND